MPPTEVKEARRKLGLTQAQLARVIGAEPETVRQWEADPSSARYRTPSAIACRSISWLLLGWRPPEWPHDV